MIPQYLLPIRKSEVLGFVLLILILVRSFDIPSFLVFLFFVLFYAFIRGLLCLISEKFASKIHLLSYFTFCTYLLFSYTIGIDQKLSNSSILGIAVSSQIALASPMFLNQEKNKSNIIQSVLSLVLLAGCLIIVFASKGRAGWIGLFVALVFILSQTWKRRTQPTLILGVAFLFIFFLTTLIYFKQGSSEGRLLIYKVSKELLENNLLQGIGSGQFKIEYNRQQAAYFSNHNIDSKEAMLADNSYYAFNDIYQLLIENGIAGAIVALFTFYFLCRHIRGVRLQEGNKHLFIGVTGSLICLLVSSLFSYPLQVFSIQIQVIFLLAVINSYPSSSKDVFSVTITTRSIAVMLILLCLVACLTFYPQSQNRIKAHGALELSKSGFKGKAIALYEKLYKSNEQNGTVLYLYAEELYYAKRLKEAKEVIERVKKLYTSNKVYSLSAKIATELGDYRSAENDFKIAVYMVPNRMSSRYDLLLFYLNRQDSVNARFWAKSILFMPIKVHSELTRYIKQEVNRIHKSLN